MGNTLSKVLVGSVISISLTSNGIHGTPNEFDRASFEKEWKAFLRQQAIDRGLDVSKYYKGYSTKSSSRSILSEGTVSSLSSVPGVLTKQALDESYALNEQLYKGIDNKYKDQKALLDTIYDIFQRVAVEITDASVYKFAIEPKTIENMGLSGDTTQLTEPQENIIRQFGIFAKIAWTKGNQKAVYSQYTAVAKEVEKLDVVNKIHSSDNKRIIGEFWFAAAQIYYATDNYADTIAAVDKAVEIAEMQDVNSMDLKYRALVEKCKAMREKRAEAEALSIKIADESAALGLKWPQSMALNNLIVVYERKNELTKAEECLDESWKLRIEIRDDQGISSSEGNSAKIKLNKMEFPEALRLYESSRNWRITNYDSWGIAGSDFAIGKGYTKIAQHEFGGKIFYGMAVRSFIPGLDGFASRGAKLGFCEVSEYLTIILTKIGEVDDAEKAANLNLYFRSITSPGQLEKDIYDSLVTLGYLEQEQIQKIGMTVTDIHAAINKITGWNNASDPKIGQLYDVIMQRSNIFDALRKRQWKRATEQEAAVKELHGLLEQYKNYGLNMKSNKVDGVNYLDVLDAHGRTRDVYLRAENEMGIAYEDFQIGKAYFEMAKTGYKESAKMLEIMGARKFFNVMKFCIPAGRWHLAADVRASLNDYGFNIPNETPTQDIATLLEQFIQCQSKSMCIKAEQQPKPIPQSAKMRSRTDVFQRHTTKIQVSMPELVAAGNCDCISKGLAK